MEHYSVKLSLAAISFTLGYALRLEPDLPSSYPTSKDTNPIMCLTLCSPSTLQIYKRGRNINRLTIAIPCPKARLCLGLPNPPMIDIAEETSGFRRSWLSQDLRLLIPTFSLLNAPVDFTIGLHCIKNAPLPHRVSLLRATQFSILSFQFSVNFSMTQFLN